jgi:hypothetical protein
MVSENRPDPRKPAAPGTPPPAKAPQYRRATPPPPIVSYEDVVASCGHPEKFGLFEDRLDRYRKDRRKKVTDRPCKACRERKRQEEEAALAVRKEERQKRAAESQQSPKRKTMGGTGRLPDGAKFEVVYDATRTQWTGTLTIGDKVFTGSAGGVFKLLNRLDRQYRDSLPPAPAE